MIIWKVGSCDITWYIPYWLVYTTFVISVVISVQSGVIYHEIWKHRRWNITWYITCDEEAHGCYIACYMPRNMVWYILELCLWYTMEYINGGIYQWWYISCDITVKYNMVYTMIYHIPLHMWYTIEYTTANIGIYQCWYIQIVLYTNIGMVYTMICKPGSRNVRRALENRSARIYSASESTRPSTTSVSPLKSATSTVALSAAASSSALSAAGSTALGGKRLYHAWSWRLRSQTASAEPRVPPLWQQPGVSDRVPHMY